LLSKFEVWEFTIHTKVSELSTVYFLNPNTFSLLRVSTNEVNMAASKNSSSDEGKEYVVVRADGEGSTTPASTDAKVEETKEEKNSVAPEILYKVNYKDYSGMQLFFHPLF
jgi:hypothetical protein